MGDFIKDILQLLNTSALDKLPVRAQRLVDLYLAGKPAENLWPNIYRFLADETVRDGSCLNEVERLALIEVVVVRLESLPEVDRVVLTKQVLSSDLADERKIYFDIDMIDKYQKSGLLKYKLTLLRKYGQKDKSFGKIPLRNEFESALKLGQYSLAKRNLYAIGFQQIVNKYRLSYDCAVKLQSRIEESASMRTVDSAELAELLKRTLKTTDLPGRSSLYTAEARPPISFL